MALIVIERPVLHRAVVPDGHRARFPSEATRKHKIRSVSPQEAKERFGLLDGIKVVEFAQNLAIPMCGRILAGMGADVVKVEPPTGDAVCAGGDFGPMEAKACALIDPDKRSMALDLTSPDATQVI